MSVRRATALGLRCTKSSGLISAAATPRWPICSNFGAWYLGGVVLDGVSKFVEQARLLMVEGVGAVQQILHFGLHVKFSNNIEAS